MDTNTDDKIVEKVANETLDLIIPRLAEEYDLNLYKPKLSITNHDYMPFNSGMFIPIGEYGVVKLQKESCRVKIGCCSTTSHEMGHAAIYQNCPAYEEYYKKQENDIFQLFDEGISEKFMKKGLKFLKEEEYISGFDFYSKSLNLGFGKFVKGLLFPDQYVIGEMIIGCYNNKGVSIKRLIISPEEFKEDLEKNWKNMISPCSRRIIDFYDKLFSKQAS